MKQTCKVKDIESGMEWFFFDHSFKTGYQHAKDFIARNKKNYTLALYAVNDSPMGDKWKLIRG